MPYSIINHTKSDDERKAKLMQTAPSTLDTLADEALNWIDAILAQPDEDFNSLPEDDDYPSLLPLSYLGHS